MKKVFLPLLFIITVISVRAQNNHVEWASVVLEATTEAAPGQYSAEQVLGKPDVPTGSGIAEHPNAWMPARLNKEEYVKVGFERPFRIRQIAIAESYNPSAIKAVYVYDLSDNEFLINEFEPRQLEIKERMLYLFFDYTDYEVSALKIVFDGSAVPGIYGIDAIAISNSTTRVTAEVNITENAIVNANPERLSSTVNSVYNELKPMVMPDGKTLLFSRQNHPGNIGGEDDPEDIWYSQWDEEKGEWTEAQNMGRPLNNKGPNYISSITPDGQTVILTLGNRYTNKEKMKSGVSMVTRTSEGWSEPIPFDIMNYFNVNDNSNFYLANNREVLLMSVETDPTLGERDLYVSFLRQDGRWTKPMNLGEDVNTASEESAPFLAPDDKTLYFSSKGYAGYGGSDIFVTRRLDDTWRNWTEPENLGPGINSEKSDKFFNIPPTGEYGYFTRDYQENNTDVYRFELPKEHQPEAVVTVRGRVYNRKTGDPISARIFYETLPDGEEVGQIYSDPLTGEYQIILPSGDMYGYLAESDGFIAINANIDLKETTEYGEINHDLYLVPIEKDAIVRMNNVFFDFDKSILKEESYPELNRVAEFMAKNPNVKILVSGHTDSIGTDSYNYKLSENRADAVMKYLVQNGVGNGRLEAKGFGKSKPIVSNDDEQDGRELNRRVEFKILEN